MPETCRLDCMMNTAVHPKINLPDNPDDFCHALCFASMVAMKLLGLAIDDMIPPEAFGGGATDDNEPVDDRLDPKEG